MDAEQKLEQLEQFLNEQVAILQQLIAEDGRYIPVRFFQGKLQAYSVVRAILKGEDEE